MKSLSRCQNALLSVEAGVFLWRRINKPVVYGLRRYHLNGKPRIDITKKVFTKYFISGDCHKLPNFEVESQHAMLPRSWMLVRLPLFVDLVVFFSIIYWICIYEPWGTCSHDQTCSFSHGKQQIAWFPLNQIQPPFNHHWPSLLPIMSHSSPIFTIIIQPVAITGHYQQPLTIINYYWRLTILNQSWYLVTMTSQSLPWLTTINHHH